MCFKNYHICILVRIYQKLTVIALVEGNQELHMKELYSWVSLTFSILYHVLVLSNL